jgi:peptidoglycan hydrolase-like protein with peptidoglycan-binding domain
MTIRKGDKGQHVMVLQAALQDAGIGLPRYGVDGIFGDETQLAVKQAQQLFSLEPTGIAEQQLFNRLNISGIHTSLPPVKPSGSSHRGPWILAGLLLGAAAYAIQKHRGKK